MNLLAGNREFCYSLGQLLQVVCFEICYNIAETDSISMCWYGFNFYLP